MPEITYRIWYQKLCIFLSVYLVEEYAVLNLILEHSSESFLSSSTTTHFYFQDNLCITGDARDQFQFTNGYRDIGLVFDTLASHSCSEGDYCWAILL